MKSILAIIFSLISTILFTNISNELYINSDAATGNQINIAVLVSNPQDPYLSLITQGLQNVENNNNGKVKFTFYDTKVNQAVESEILDRILESNFDLILGNLVDTKVETIENFIDKIKQKNIPAVLYNPEPPVITNKIITYPKLIIVRTNPKEAGILQGKLIVDEWNKNKSTIDKNKDNVLQYVMLQGAVYNVGAVERTKYCISTIENSGIKVQELSKKILFWNQQLAKESVESIFLQYGNKIEMILLKLFIK